MERRHGTILAVGFALALPIVIGPLINSAAADGEMASNSQLRGQYTGTGTGGCLIRWMVLTKTTAPSTIQERIATC